MDIVKPEHYFDLSQFEHREVFDGLEFVWDVLKRISEYVRAVLKPAVKGKVMDGAYVDDDVYVGEGTIVEPGAYIKGPAIIGSNVEVRQGAYIRGDVIVGDGAVIGHVSEFKNCIIMNGAQVPHFSYVGDSVLGIKSHLGAGVIISNLKVTRDEVVVRINGQEYNTGLRKFGVIMGDGVEVGCNAVINPGTLIAPHSLVYPLASLRGYYPPRAVIKLRQRHEIVERR
ncbi:MAG TPA: hypothetical protein EYP10_09445 [Armatimonadetes bacterium]|nr:hypothetical protein [Armatimonadota bacterium]